MKFYCTPTTCLFILIFLSVGSTAQTTVLRGEITDAESGETLIGASMLIEGTSEGTTTDFDGNFELRTKTPKPFTIIVSYTGYQELNLVVDDNTDTENMKIRLSSDVFVIEGVEVTGQRVTDKQKASPLTVESMDVLAIKETPSDNFYDGLGSMKGVDLTAASLGFKVINTRGFNSTSPVRSLQIIDGVDNQAPGLNFSLGNFLGSPELDVVKVDLIQGASSPFYGPNAFNGVISMESKNPFYFRGLAGSVKVGERNLVETAFRFAESVNNRDSLPFMAYKINFSYLRADDWEAENYDPVYETTRDQTNPGGYNAVNVYGDEYFPGNDFSTAQPWTYPGLDIYYRKGYREIDLVDYDTRNTKANAALYFRTSPKRLDDSPELIFASSFGNGTTVYQGDNRFSLKDIRFFQNRIEFRKKDKFFLRAYSTNENAGNSYDPYFTALKLQEEAKDNNIWSLNYSSYWNNNIRPKATALGFPQPVVTFDPMTGQVVITFDQEGADQWLVDYQDSLFVWHAQSQAIANQASPANPSTKPFLEPGSPEFEEAFNRITSAKSNEEEGGTRFFDRSALYHVAGEYVFTPAVPTLQKIVVGGSGRLYVPDSDGTIFTDTADVTITNHEFGAYAGLEFNLMDDRFRINGTGRVDKNENYDLIPTVAASLVWKPRPNNYFRLSYSSAIRNPTLTDQYLNLNVGPAILIGNLMGFDSLVPLECFDDYRDGLNPDALCYIDVAPVKPEKVSAFEVGYRTTLFNSLYVDAGYYYNRYRDFLGFNIGADVELNPANGLIEDLQIYRVSANSDSTVTSQGLSIGLNYYFADYYQLSGNYSWNKLISDVDDPIVPAFNTPEHKFNIGLSGRNITMKLGNLVLRNWGFSINYKWIDEFLFEGSPQFTGIVESYTLLDAQLNYNHKKWHTTFKLGASNLLNSKNFQTYGGPRIGRLAYFSITYDFKKL